MIVIRDKSFAHSREIFHDHVLATAILHRLLHHATTLNIRVQSYWLRERKKTGQPGCKINTDEKEEVTDALSPPRLRADSHIPEHRRSYLVCIRHTLLPS